MVDGGGSDGGGGDRRSMVEATIGDDYNGGERIVATKVNFY